MQQRDAWIGVDLCVSRAGADWPNWRGPNGNGSVSTGSFPTTWTIENIAWKYSMPGKGSSTPIVLNGRIYMTTPADRQEAISAC